MAVESSALNSEGMEIITNDIIHEMVFCVL